MADDTDDEAKEYPLWGRIIAALIFLGGGFGLGWVANGTEGLVWGGVFGVVLALLMLFVPPVLVFLMAVVEVLSFCSF